MVICLERGADLHMAQLMPLPLTVSCISKIQIGFTFLVPAHPGSPGKRAVKQVCVCVCLLGLGSGSGRGRYMWRADILVHSDRADLSRRRRTSRGVYVIGQRVSWAKLMQFGVSFRRPPDGCVSWIRQWRGDALNMDYRRVTNIRISAHLTHSRKFRNFVFFCHWGDDIFWSQSPHVFTGMCTKERKVDPLGPWASRIHACWFWYFSHVCNIQGGPKTAHQTRGHA